MSEMNEATRKAYQRLISVEEYVRWGGDPEKLAQARQDYRDARDDQWVTENEQCRAEQDGRVR